MSTPFNHFADGMPPVHALRHKIRCALDAINRATDNVSGGELTPAACAYIDVQLAKAIGYLASARAIAITQGTLQDAAFDTEAMWDLDDEIGLAASGSSTGEKGGAS